MARTHAHAHSHPDRMPERLVTGIPWANLEILGLGAGVIRTLDLEVGEAELVASRERRRAEADAADSEAALATKLADERHTRAHRRDFDELADMKRREGAALKRDALLMEHHRGPGG